MADAPKHLSQALSELVALKGLARVGSDGALREAWESAAGPEISGKTRVLGIKRGVLEVAVANSALLSELTSFHKGSLLKALQSQSPDLAVHDLKFRLQGDMET